MISISKFQIFRTLNLILKKKKKINFSFIVYAFLEQVKDHLLDLLPKFIFIVDNLSRFVAVSDHVSYVSFFNEGRLFNEIIENEKYIENNHKKYVLPIMIEISHEFLSHMKTRYGNLCDSPILHSIGGKNNLCANNLENESGYAL